MIRSMLLTVVLLCSVLPSCNIAPTVMRRADGTLVASMGGNVLGRVKGMQSRITTREGDTIEYKVDDQDNSAVASNYLGYKALANIADNLTSRLKSSDGVKAIAEKGKASALVKGTKDPNVIPLDPNKIPVDPNVAAPAP